VVGHTEGTSQPGPVKTTSKVTRASARNQRRLTDSPLYALAFQQPMSSRSRVGGRAPENTSAAPPSTGSVRRGALALEVLQALEGAGGLERQVVDAGGVQARALLERVLGDRRQELGDLLLHRHEEPDVVRVPADVHA